MASLSARVEGESRFWSSKTSAMSKSQSSLNESKLFGITHQHSIAILVSISTKHPLVLVPATVGWECITSESSVKQDELRLVQLALIFRTVLKRIFANVKSFMRISLAATMQSDGQPSDACTATLEAFYARVMQRVCAAYCEESDLPADEAVTLLEKKWKDKLALYTGSNGQSIAAAQIDEVSVADSVASSGESAIESSDEEDSFLSSSSSSSISEAASEQAVGRPSAQLPGAANTAKSVFARMLGAKRKLHQLDGAESDTEDDMEWLDHIDQEPLILQSENAEMLKATDVQNDDEGAQADAEDNGEEGQGEEEGQVRQDSIHGEDEEEKEEQPSSPAASTAATSFLVSASDLAPVSGLSGINLPLQLAAEYSSFKHRGKRRGYVGQLHAIVLTWPSRLGARETILPGELVWCCPDSERAFLDEGELVKVRSLGDSLHEVRVELSNGSEATVQVARVRRLKEYLIRKGSVRLRSQQ